MTDDDLGRLGELLDGIAELRQRPKPTNRAKALFAKVLANYDYETIERAVLCHLESEAGTYTTALQPAHIVAQIKGMQAKDGRLDGDEAWAIALAASDEHATVVWTEEIAAAAAIAHPLLASGDIVGARLAFRSAYQRLVQNARETHRPVRWFASLGHDPELRQPVLTQAVRQDLLPVHQAYRLLAAPGTLPGSLHATTPSSDAPPAVTDRERGNGVADSQLRKLRELLANGAARTRRHTNTLKEKHHGPVRPHGRGTNSSQNTCSKITPAHALD